MKKGIIFWETSLRKYSFAALGALFFVFFANVPVARALENTVTPNAGEDKTVYLGDVAEFTVEESAIPPKFSDAEVEYWWNFGDRSQIQKGITVSHTYETEGDYTAEVMAKTPLGDFSDSVNVNVTTKTLFVIAGKNEDAIHLANVLNQAERLDFLVTTVLVDDGDADFTLEDRILADLLMRAPELVRSRLIIGWTKGSTEINALLRLPQETLSGDGFANTSIVIATDAPALTSRRVKQLYDILQPKNAAVISPALMKTALQGEAKANLIGAIQGEGEDFTLVNVHSRGNSAASAFYNFFSRFVGALIKRGVAVNTILLILMLPIVATIVSFFRHVIGVKSLGVYIPSILTITFVAIGIYAGLLMILLIVSVGTLARLVLRPIRLLYLPRMALTITAVSCAILALFYFSVRIPNLSLVSVSAFPVLILIMLVEAFVKVQIEEGARGALILTLETILLSIVSFFIVNGTFFRGLLLAYPEIIFLSFLTNILLGKWTGLRLWEYYRFREVIEAMGLRQREKR